MHKLKKIIISLTLAFLLLFSFSLSVFAVHSSGGGSSDEVKQWSEDLSKLNTNGYTYVYNSTDIASSTLMKGENYVNSWGYSYFDDDYVIEIADISRDADGNITALYFRKPTEHYEYIRAYEYKNIGAGEIYHYLNCNDNLFNTLYSAYSTTPDGIHIDWSHISIKNGLVEAGETFEYYDYFGNPKTVTFNGNGGIFGIDNGGNFELPEGQFPSIADYIPDLNDEKYKLSPLSDFLPEMPDSLDILDWIKYITSILPITFTWFWEQLSRIISYCIDLFKGFFSFISDFFKAFFENFRIIILSFFNTDDLNIGDYFKSKFIDLKDYLVLKIPFFHTIELIKQSISNIQDSGSVVFTFSAVTLPFGRGAGQAVVIPEFPVTIDIVNVIRKWTDPIIIGLCYLSSFIFFKQKIPEVFGGVGGAVAESYSADNKHTSLKG